MAYDINSIESLSFREGVRKRIQMYLGSDDIEGTYQALKEIINNSTDEALAGYGKKIEVHVNEIENLTYVAGGCTAMNDGIGTAIDKVGKWLSDMNEEDRPSKTLVVIMTDGAENASKEYSFDRVKEMIKHQEEKYNWTFMYMGTDITSMKDVKSLGIRMSAFSSRKDFASNYSVVNEATKMYRTLKADAYTASATMDAFLSTSANEMTTKYETENNIKITNL